MRRSQLIAVALAWASIVSIAQAADTVQVRGGEHPEGYARIAIEWPSPVKFDAKLAGETLTIHFARPFSAPLTPLLEPLKHYVASVTQSPDGATITAKLIKPVEIKTATVNGTIAAIDLVAKPPTPPKSVEKPVGKKAAAEVPKPKAPAPKPTPKLAANDTVTKNTEPAKAEPPRLEMSDALAAAVAPAVGAPMNLLSLAQMQAIADQEVSQPVPPAAPAPLAAKLAAEKPAPEAVQIRGAEHEQGYARIAIEWPAPVTFDAKLDGNTLTINFARPFTAKLAPLAAQLEHYADSIEQGADGKSIIAKLKRPVELKTSTVNGTIASVDLVARPAAVAEKTPPNTPEAPATAKKSKPAAKEAKAKDTKTVAVQKPEPSKPETRKPEPVKDRAGIAQPTSSSRQALAPISAPPTATALEAAPVPIAASNVGNRGADGGKVNLTPGLTVENDRTSLRFDWPMPVGAVIYRRGGTLWIVFAASSTLDLSSARNRGQPMLQAIDEVRAEGATALRLVTADGINPSVRRAGTSWIVDFKRQGAVPDTPIVIDPRFGPKVSTVELHVREAGMPMRLRDPVLGDTLTIVPVGEIGRGIGATQDFVDFRLLPSVQGIVIRANADDLLVKSDADAVRISRPQGLVISNDQDRLLGRAIPKANRLFDLAAWRGPRTQNFFDRRIALEQAITSAPPGGRTRPRLALARFFFANAMGPEALSVLAQITREDPKAAVEQNFRALKGASCLLANLDDCAAQELGQKSLDDEPEAALWRGSIAFDKADWPTAAQQFTRGANLLSTYPKILRHRFALQAAEAMIEGDTPSAATPLLDLVMKESPNRADQAMAFYLQGRVQQRLGEFDAATALWNKAIALDDRKARARALYARAMASYEAKKATRADTIKSLEALRYAWRGDDFEFNLLRRLGELKLAEKDVEGGLAMLFQATSYFPDSPLAKDIVKQAGDSFADLFIGKASEDMPPLKALAVYDAFHDIEPVGERRDAIVRKLIDRLVSVDLLDRAASLLEDQVKTRLNGVDKARGATQLALLRLMNHQPEMAVAALDLDVAAGLTPELARQRQELRARALLDQNHPGEALTMLNNDDSRDSYRLRADIYWRQRDWRNAARTFMQLAGAPPTEGSLQPEMARIVLSWAAALTLDSDQVGINKLRQDFGAAIAGTPAGEAFNIITGDPNVAAAGGGSPNDIAERVAQVGALQNFMTAYKQRLATDKLSAIN